MVEYVGIDIKLKDRDEHTLYEICKFLRKNNCIWKIDEDEIIIQVNGELQNFSHKEIMNATEFNKILSIPSQVIFAKISRWPVGEATTDIHNFRDYEKSNCTAVVFCTDSIYYEIYNKNKEEFEKMMVYLNASENIEEAVPITKQNIPRKIFHIR